MKRLCLLLGLVLFGAGCSSDANKGQWADFWRDLRGDNQQMRSNFGGGKDQDESTWTLKP
jgi:hypothetical protein